MIVYRLGKQKCINDLTGMGSSVYGGRWNNKGVRMVYSSDSRALAMAELAVNLPLGKVPKDYFFIKFEIPNDGIMQLDLKFLDDLDWKTSPPCHQTQEIGNKFIEDKVHLALKVPSVVVEGEFNYLLNPRFPDFTKQVNIIDRGPFPFDQRIFIRPGKE